MVKSSGSCYNIITDKINGKNLDKIAEITHKGWCYYGLSAFQLYSKIPRKEMINQHEEDLSIVITINELWRDKTNKMSVHPAKTHFVGFVMSWLKLLSFHCSLFHTFVITNFMIEIEIYRSLHLLIWWNRRIIAR